LDNGFILSKRLFFQWWSAIKHPVQREDIRMNTKILAGAAVMGLALAQGAAAQTVSTADQIIADLQAQGYTRIEIDEGTARIEVEAISGMTEFEARYDATTGSVIWERISRVDSDDDTTPGVFRERDDSLDRVDLEADRGDDDDDDDDGDRNDDDDDDDDDDHDSDDDNDDDSDDDNNDDSDDD
jgi:hypothetical protein